MREKNFPRGWQRKVLRRVSADDDTQPFASGVQGRLVWRVL
jgi:hypothetical protein